MKPQSPTERLSIFDRLFRYMDDRLPSDRFVISILLFVFIASGLYSLHLINKSYIVKVPTSGGTLVEGVVGTPRFVNPVLAITRADHDLVSLSYSGILRLSEAGDLQNDLAESVTVSEDGLVYNIVLRQDKYFHDGTQVTAEDVSFTIGLIQDPDLKSPIRGNWSGVTVEKLGDFELNIILADSYTPFIENLTTGILPKHIWGTLSNEELPFSQYNIEPIGSGPYQVVDIRHNEAGLISEYDLKAFSADTDPTNITSIIIRFYQNEAAVIDALNKKEINATAALSEKSIANTDLSNYSIVEQPLPRVFSVFFNQNKSPVLRDPAVRKVLELLIDRETLVDSVLYGYGSPTDSPIPPGFSNIELSSTSSTKLANDEKIAAAKEILFNANWIETEDGQWEKEIDKTVVPLGITIRSSNAAVFEKTAAYLSEVWSPLGIDVNVELFEQSDLIQTVIRPRDYQALLFGVDVGRSLDFYPFWHSSQREDPGLNVSLYTNITTDKLLTDMRTTRDMEKRNQDMQTFVDEIAKETPALFLFTPSFEYILSTNVRVTNTDRLAKPNERFSNIKHWFMNESNVWPIFAE